MLKQSLFYKFMLGVFALSFAFVMGCGGSDSTSASSESGEDSSSDSDSTEVSSSSEDEEISSSSEDDEKSSSSIKSSSSSSKKESKSSSSSKKVSSSSSQKEWSIELEEVPSECPVKKHSKKVKTLTKSSENTISGSSLQFDNEFATKDVSEVTYYEDGSFFLKCGDEKRCLARTRFVNSENKNLDDLGKISVNMTFVTGGEADSSYVGASAYASNDNELLRVNVYFVEGYISDSDLFAYGEEFTDVSANYENYTIFKSLSQKQVSKGTEKTYTYFVIHEASENCVSIEVSSLLKHIPEIADDDVQLRWVAVSTEVRGHANAAVDMLEAKINVENKNPYVLDESETADEFCKETKTHPTSGVVLETDGASQNITVDDIDYKFEVFTANEGFSSEVFFDGSFKMDCQEGNDNCEVNLFRVFKEKQKYTSLGRIDVEYSFSKEGSGGESIMGVHGYMDDDGREVEFFVLEDWLESFHINSDFFGEKKGEITVDGSSYDVYYLAVEANAENQLVKDQYRITSVRSDKRRCGTVNVSAQMDKWTKDLGIDVFPLVKVGPSGFFVAGASGTADFTYAKVNVQERE